AHLSAGGRAQGRRVGDRQRRATRAARHRGAARARPHADPAHEPRQGRGREAIEVVTAAPSGTFSREAEAQTPMISHIFIDRPIFASVLSIVIVIVGIVALSQLPVAQYPEVAPPTVQVSAIYPGADAQVVADTVASPIEQEVNGVENML